MSSQSWIDRQLRRRGIDDERVLAAMAAVPRERFVPVEARARAYDDAALSLSHGQTISQPYMVALTCQLLALPLLLLKFALLLLLAALLCLPGRLLLGTCALCSKLSRTLLLLLPRSLDQRLRPPPHAPLELLP